MVFERVRYLKSRGASFFLSTIYEFKFHKGDTDFITKSFLKMWVLSVIDEKSTFINPQIYHGTSRATMEPAELPWNQQSFHGASRATMEPAELP